MDKKEDIMKNIKIDINKDDISDVIMIKKVESGRRYINLMTEKESYDIDGVIRNRRFIIFEESSVIMGTYVKYIEETDGLLFIIAELENDNGIYKWQEIRRRWYVDGHGSAWKEIWGYADICGQACISCESNFNVGARKILLDYFGGAVINQNTDHETDFHAETFQMAGDIQHIELSDIYRRKKGVLAFHADNNTKSKEEEIIPFPCEAEKALIKYGQHKIHCAEKSSMMNAEISAVGIIQNIGGIPVFRRIHVCIIPSYPIKKSEIRLIETSRFYLDDMIIGPKAFFLQQVPIWTDDLSDTALRYSNRLLKKVSEAYCDLEYSSIRLYNSIKSELKEEIEQHDIILFAVAKAYDSLLEKILNMDFIRKEYFCAKLFASIRSGTDPVQEAFGGVNRNETDIHKILGLPKGLLQHILDEFDDFADIAKIKKIFAGGNEDFFKRMNEEDARYLYDELFLLKTGWFRKDKMIETFKDMIRIYGVQSWKKYVLFLINMDRTTLYIYNDFLKSVDKIRATEFADMVKEMGWKQNEESLNIVFPTVSVINTIISEKISFDDMKEKMKKNKAECEKYEFKKYGLHIEAAEKPQDLVMEGVVLNHCVARFLPFVLAGKIKILFIRKDSEPDKPFYTLEVRDGKIRQCHGFDNCNMTPEVREFVKEFCRKNKITFTEGEKALGV